MPMESFPKGCRSVGLVRIQPTPRWQLSTFVCRCALLLNGVVDIWLVRIQRPPQWLVDYVLFDWMGLAVFGCMCAAAEPTRGAIVGYRHYQEQDSCPVRLCGFLKNWNCTSVFVFTHVCEMRFYWRGLCLLQVPSEPGLRYPVLARELFFAV